MLQILPIEIGKGISCALFYDFTILIVVIDFGVYDKNLSNYTL